MPRILRALRRFAANPALPASIFLFGNLFIFEPATVQDGNQPYIYYSLFQHLVVLFPFFLIFTLLGVLVTVGNDSTGKRWYTAALTALAFAAWVNSSFFSGSNRILDGRSFEILSDHIYLVWNSLFLGLLFIAILLVAYRFANIVRWFVIFMVTLLSINTAYIVVSDTNHWRNSVNLDRLYKFSSQSSVLVILLDMFQSDFFDEILRSHGKFADKFSGFTYFRNAVGVAPTTYLSMPAIHSGLAYRSGQSLREFYLENVVGHSFMSELAANGYSGFLVNPVGNYCPKGIECDTQDRVIHGITMSWFRSAARMFDLALFRIVPHVLKSAVYNRNMWLVSNVTIGQGRRAGDSNDVLDKIAENLQVNSTRPTVKFLHLLNTHPEFELDSNCSYVGGVKFNRENAIVQGYCALNHVITLLDALQKRGIYDRTTILIIADHGAGLPQDGDHELGAQAAPLFLIKPAGSNGALQRSEALVSLTDIPATVCAETGACKWSVGSNALQLDPRVRRKFTFVEYSWRHDYWQYDIFPIDQVYLVQGKPSDIDSWSKVFGDATGDISSLSFGSKDGSLPYGLGWAGAEGDGAGKSWQWAMGPAASLHLKPPRGSQGRVEALVSTHGGNPHQTVEVLANGLPVFRGNVEAAPPQKIEFTVPPEVIQSGTLRLTFKFGQWNPPGNGDPRKLSVIFYQLRVQ